jgi:hypothetical protein
MQIFTVDLFCEKILKKKQNKRSLNLHDNGVCISFINVLYSTRIYVASNLEKLLKLL